MSSVLNHGGHIIKAESVLDVIIIYGVIKMLLSPGGVVDAISNPRIPW